MRRLKKLKLSVALLASGLMAYSPVTMAAMNKDQKNALNATIRDTFKGNYNDFYQVYGGMFDATTQANMGKWLKEFGHTKLPSVQAQIVKDKKGKEAIKLVLNDGGQTLVITMDPNDRNFVDLNGTKVDPNEMMDIPALARKMAQKDKNLNALLEDINKSDRSPASANEAVKVGYAQFERMTVLQRVEYMSLLRLSGEAAQKVLELDAEKQTKTSSLFMLHPLLAAQLAFAQVKTGTKCVVAGNLSTYEKLGTRIACSPFTKEMEWANSLCSRTGTGKPAACNPMVYGFRDDGAAHCLDTGNVADFTKKATQDCGGPTISPLPGQEGSAERIAAYRKIAESYAKNTKGREGSKVSACFNADNLIKDTGDCRSMFSDHEKGFRELMEKAEGVCGNAEKAQKTPDQELACKELLERKLFLNYFSMTTPAPADPDAGAKKACTDVGGTYGYDRETRMNVCTCPGGAVGTLKDGKYTCPTTADQDKAAACEKLGGKYGYDRELKTYVCTCKDGAIASPGKNNTFTCPGGNEAEACQKANGEYGYDREAKGYYCKCKDGSLAKEKGREYETCREDSAAVAATEKEGFCKKNKWVCLTPLFLLGGALLWKWLKPGKSNPTPVTPIPCQFGCVPYVPPTEGGTTVTVPGNAGGVRPQPQPKPTGPGVR
jgi:hypothetical protein